MPNFVSTPLFFSYHSIPKKWISLNVNNIIILTHTTEKMTERCPTRQKQYTVHSPHTTQRNTIIFTGMENNFTISWKLLQQICYLVTPHCVMIKRKEGFPPPTPHPTIHLRKICLYCLYTILFGSGGGRSRLKSESKWEGGTHQLFVVTNTRVGVGGRNRLKLENEEGGGAYQLTLQLTVYRTIHISSPSPSTIKIIKTTK